MTHVFFSADFSYAGFSVFVGDGDSDAESLLVSYFCMDATSSKSTN
jgi:hypothetical protein